MEDELIYLLHFSYLERAGRTVRIMFFDFFSDFSTIQPKLLGDRLAGVNLGLELRLPDKLGTVYKGAWECESHMLLCSTGAPQGTLLAPFPFTFYTSDLMGSSPTCHLQKFPYDSAIMEPTELPTDQCGENQGGGGGSL